MVNQKTSQFLVPRERKLCDGVFYEEMVSADLSSIRVFVCVFPCAGWGWKP